MAENNLTKARETIGKDSKITLAVMETMIFANELGKKMTEAKGKKVEGPILSSELSQNMIIVVSEGGHPNREEEMDK